MKFFVPYAISAIVWLIIGSIRLLEEVLFQKQKVLIKGDELSDQLTTVAIIIPAHNEKKVLDKTINSARRIVPRSQIYVVDDASTDTTFQIAKGQKVNVLRLKIPHGKARALRRIIEHHSLLRKYKYILFLDADTILKKDYLKNALQLFHSSKDFAAIAGYVISSFRKHKGLSRRKFYEGYRFRQNKIYQMFITYGQTWKYTNVAQVLPGSCSIYKTKVLKKMVIDAPGLIIEDFNLAFQIQKNKLGLIGHHPSISSKDQDPDNLPDYWRQVFRWNKGYFQTVRLYGIWPSGFWLAQGFFLSEVFISSFFFLFLPVAQFPLYRAIGLAPLSLPDIVVLFILIDYSFTALVALVTKKYKLLIYGLGFFIFYPINSAILFLSLTGLFTRSDGLWSPPQRR